jgi:AcrR family transcriptional regulator
MNERSFINRGTMAGKAAKEGEGTRGVLVAAALRLFVQQGYHGTSMRDIASAAHLALGGIYNHFKDKEQIFDAVIRAHHPLIHLQALLDDVTGDAAEDILRSAAIRIVSEQETNPAYLHLLFIEAVEFQGKHTADIIALVLPHLDTFVQRLERAGGQLQLLPPALLFSAFIGALLAYSMAQRLFGREAGTLENYLQVYLSGVAR